MLITFEGIDGCGKTTQIKLLAEFLQARNMEVITLREPGGTEFSEYIREVLLNSKFKVNAAAELFLFEAARSDLVEKVIIPALNEGKIVICDRYYDSTTAYQGYGRDLPLQTMDDIHSMAIRGLRPTLTFYLHIPLELSLKRGENKKPDKIESSGREFFERVISGYKEIARREPERFIQIDATGDIESTHKIIVEKIINLLEVNGL